VIVNGEVNNLGGFMKEDITKGVSIGLLSGSKFHTAKVG
jgi:hypothetical protein